jgi:hypothetical protein
MTIRTRPGRAALALALALTIPLSGCYGTSEDKGDNSGSIITPKPSTVEDANTAGSRKSVLPDPDKANDSKAANPTEGGPK